MRVPKWEDGKYKRIWEPTGLNRELKWEEEPVGYYSTDDNN